MLRCVGLSQKFVELISEYITTPTFSILINRIPKGFIANNRGNKEGDPLSSYLFIVAMEHFTLQMELASYNMLIRTIHSFHHRLCHLLYADDLIICLKSTCESAHAIINIFNKLEVNVGLQVNDQKTKCYFNKFCRNKDFILHIMKVSERDLLIKYLGVPLSLNKITDRKCAALIASIRDKLFGWSSRLLFLRREQNWCTLLFKLRSTSGYKHSSYLLHLWRKQKKFALILYGKVECIKIKHQDLCGPKTEEGVGLRRLKDIRETFTLKQVWRIINCKGLWARWIIMHHLHGRPSQDQR